MSEADAPVDTSTQDDQPAPAGSPPAARRWSRRSKILLGVGGVLVAVPAIALVLLLTYDWNKARPWLNAKTSEAIGRPFRIVGDLSLTWEKPAIVSDTSIVVPTGLTGYVIYRNDSLIEEINNPDSLTFYDYGLEPGVYSYGIAAKYDLSAYGFPGQEAESLPAGPLHIPITWGRQLPFFESWNAASFSFRGMRGERAGTSMRTRNQARLPRFTT